MLTQKLFESMLDSLGIPWKPYIYGYAASVNAGELAYAVEVGRWCKVVVYSTIEPNSKMNLEEGVAGKQRESGADSIHFVLEYTNGKEIKAVGSYPRIYRRGSPERVLGDVALVIKRLVQLASLGFEKRCGCGRVRPPRYKKRSALMADQSNWFLGACLEYGKCPFTQKGGPE